MIVLAVCWAIIALAAFPIGCALLLVFAGSQAIRTGDRVLLALWLGLIACAWLASVIALFTAVTPVVIGTVAGVVAAIAWIIVWRTPDARMLLAEVLRGTRWPQVIAIIVIVATAAFVAANLRPTPDTGFYHFPAIRWFAEYGAVTGVAHINDPFGFISSLWPMVAPFDTALAGRSGGCINGFILCLIGGQIALAMTRALRGKALQSDVFLGVSSFCLLLISLAIGSYSTPSPDPAVVSLTVMVAWRMLAACEREVDDARMFPLLLACGALSFKLSALLLVPVAGLYAVWDAVLRRWVISAIVTAVLIAPLVVTSVIASGCFPFPSSMGCLPVSWALPKETVDELARLMTLFTRWDSRPPPDAGAWNWIPGWLTAARFWLNASVFWPFAISLCGFFWIALRRGISRCELWILALIAPSLALVFVMAPEVRHNSGLFFIPIALFAMRAVSLPRKPLPETAAIIMPVVLVAVIAVAPSAAIEFRRKGYIDFAGRLLWPTAVPDVAISPKGTQGFNYNLAIAGDCWRAQLPCAPSQLPPTVLRSRERGVAGGFQSAP